MNLLTLYEKLERLVQRLPQPLQSPILREITPIKTLFLQQRPPRILLLGDRSASSSALANALFADSVAKAEEDHVQAGGWQLYTHGHGRLRMLDGRRPAATAPLRRAMATEPPDLCLFLESQPRGTAELAPDMQQARELLRDLHAAGEEIHLPVIAVSVNRPGAVDAEMSRRAMHEAFADPASHPFGEKVAGYVILHGGEGEAHELAKAIAMELPPEARLEMGRLSGVRELQRETAQVVIKSMSAICGAIGAQPIPLADFPILTSLQAAMVAGIMHISGRELSMKLAGEWMAAMGANIGMALALREGARAALKFVPIWGDVVSGGIAAAGTYAIGRAASAYFIEGMTLQDARQLFRKSKKPAPLLKE